MADDRDAQAAYDLFWRDWYAGAPMSFLMVQPRWEDASEAVRAFWVRLVLNAKSAKPGAFDWMGA